MQTNGQSSKFHAGHSRDDIGPRRSMRRRLQTLGIVALVALGGVLTAAGPVLADTLGASKTEVFVTETETSYGEPIHISALITDISDSCIDFIACDYPFGRVDFYAVQGTTQTFALSAYVASEEATPWNSDTTTGELEICCLEPGAYTLRAYFVPQSFDPSSGDTGPITVGKNGSTITIQGSPATTTVGQTVTFNVHVAGYSAEAGAAAPVGFADVFDGPTNYGTAAINGNGDVTISTSQLPLGVHSLRARWGGDDHYLAATSAPFTITVGGGSSATTLNASTTSTTYGAPITFTAGVVAVPSSDGTPTGDVDFLDGGAAGSTLGTATLDEGSPNEAAFSTSELSVGTHVISASYRGDGVFGGSLSGDVTVQVAKADTTTTLTSSANPSTFGQTVTFTATVDGPGTTTVPGTVQFKDGATALGGPQPLVLGQATLTMATLGGGGHSITAVYSGSASYKPSASAALVQTVACDKLITGISSSVTVSSGGSTCLSGAKITGNITVAAGGSLSIVNSTVSGSVTVSAPATSGAAIAAIAAVGASGSVTVCGSTISGNVRVSGVGGFVLIGDTLQDACAGNTIKGGVTISGTSGGLAVADNRITGGVTVANNTGDGTPGHPGLEVKANRIGGYLACSGNNPAVTDAGRPNIVRGWIVFG
jgi:Bacterial Ig-like domain (group 3)